MDKIYYVLGFISFWAAVLFAFLVIVYYTKLFWDRYFVRIWAFQVYEYYQFRQFVKKGKVDVDKAKYFKALLEGRVKGLEYRKRSIFRKPVIKTLDKIINQ
jgi:hypothetical protein